MSEINLHFLQGLTESEQIDAHHRLLDHPGVDVVISDHYPVKELPAYRPLIKNVSVSVLPEVTPSEILERQLINMLPAFLKAKRK